MSEDPTPSGWSTATLADVVSGYQAGRNLKASGYPAMPGKLGVLKISAVTWGEFRPDENKALLPGDRPKPHELVRAGDLLITRANTTELVGAVVLVESDYPTLMLPDKILRLVTRPDRVNSSFLMYALRTQAVREYLEANASGTSDSMRNLSQAKLSRTKFPLPPLNEQRRIADKIEALTERSRRAREALDAIPPLLERFRESVLAAAFRGDLTADWRAKNPDVEPADQLLDRIRVERRRRWEEDYLARHRAKGKAPTNDSWKAEYTEPEPVNKDALAELPGGWCWASLEQVALDGPRNGYSPLCGGNGVGPLVLKLSATTSGYMRLDETTTKRALVPVAENAHGWLAPGDLLVQRANTLQLLGAAAVYLGPPSTYIYPDLMMRLQVFPDGLRDYLCCYLNSRNARAFLQARATGTAGNMPKINSSTLRCLPVPVPPLLELTHISARLASMTSHTTTVGRMTHASLAQSRSLESAVLAKAFRGELVPHEPKD